MSVAEAPVWGFRGETPGALPTRAGGEAATRTGQALRELEGEGPDASPAAPLAGTPEGGGAAAPGHGASSQLRELAGSAGGAEAGYLDAEGTQGSAYARVFTPQEARRPHMRQTSWASG